MERSLAAFHRHTPGANIEIKSKRVRPGQVFVYHVPFSTLTAAGDVVNNLGGALDHLVYQLILAHRPQSTQKDLGLCQFPIGKDEAAYHQAKRSRLKGVSAEAVKAIDALKPYKDGNDALWLLSSLDNASKHRVILSVGKIVMCHAEWVGEISLSPVFMYKFGRPQFSGIYARPKMKEEALLPGRETLRKIRITKREALLPTLNFLVDTVDELVSSFLLLLN